MPRKQAVKTKAGNKRALKMKTNRSVKKRFTITGTGKLKRMKSNKNHILEKKSPKRKRNLRKSTLVSKTMQDNYKKVLPYL